MIEVNPREKTQVHEASVFCTEILIKLFSHYKDFKYADFCLSIDGSTSRFLLRIIIIPNIRAMTFIAHLIQLRLHLPLRILFLRSEHVLGPDVKVLLAQPGDGLALLDDGLHERVLVEEAFRTMVDPLLGADGTRTTVGAGIRDQLEERVG